MSAALSQAAETAAAPQAGYSLWWLKLPIRRRVWAWQRAIRGGLREAAGAFLGSLLLAAAIALVFAGLARRTSHSPADAIGLATILSLYQLVVLIGSLPGRGDRDLLAEPVGALLPYSSAHLAVLWAARVFLPVAMLLGLAHAGLAVLAGRVSVWFGTLAWVADSAALSALVLFVAVGRWFFSTYAPIELRRVVLFLGDVLFRNLGLCVFAAFFAITVQYVVTGVFISSSFERSLEAVPPALGDASQGPPPGLVAALDPLRRLTGHGHTSLMTRLLLAPEEPFSTGAVACRVSLLAAAVPLLLLPGRRRELPSRLVAFGSWLRHRLSDAVVRLTPSSLRLAMRLGLPYLVDTLFLSIPSSAVLFSVALAQALSAAQVRLGQPPRVVPGVVLAGFASALGALSAVSLTPGTVLRRTGLEANAYRRLCTLPSPPARIIGQLLGVCLALAVLQQGSVALLWARLVGQSWPRAGLFAGGVAFVAGAGLSAVTNLHVRLWRRSPYFLRVAGAVITFAFGALIVLDYRLLDRPHALAVAVGLEVGLGLLGIGFLGSGLATMVRDREPASA